MASGVACRLHRSNFNRILMTEIPEPLAVRREVSFCEAIRDSFQEVEGIYAYRIDRVQDAASIWEKNAIPIIVDPGSSVIKDFRPNVIVDAIMAKENLGLEVKSAELVIALGPGFTAGIDCHCVIETNRGHDLGRLFYSGSASKDTGIPGEIAGYSHERVLRAPTEGLFFSDLRIGELVKASQEIGSVSDQKIVTRVSGALRGLIRSGSWVEKNLKIGDVDPRGVIEHCFTISEKTRSLGGSVLEAILNHYG